MRFLVGIDDTDNLESRGTGHRARQLSEALADGGFEPRGVTRHQLFVDSRIPYTSHNSSACIEVEAHAEDRDRVVALSRAFLLEHSAPGSDAGLCVTAVEAVADGITAFGTRAKREVVKVAEASELAASIGAHLEGLTGTGLGVIGALAAVGLLGHWRAFAGAGARPLLLGGITWFAVAATSLVMQAITQQL